ncbi:MAG: hypothetical protein JSS32_02445 [Verrucomicrobia bacterium]|nr:hypothetical protein [Verrucomicrobiota bacterium]
MMVPAFFSLWIVLFCAMNPLVAMNRAAGALQAISENAGVRTFKYEDPQRKRPVTVELWYPTQAEGPFDVPDDRIWVHPKEIRNAPFSSFVKNSPLIVMSHGHGGERRNLSWLAELLVRCGFVVASVDHFGNTGPTFNLLLSLKFWERAKDITFALDQLIQEPILEGKIDKNRIGFVGYSLGGMTGLGLGGATVGSIEEIIAAASNKHRDIKPEILAQLDPKEARQSLEDERIRAMLLICPASFAYKAESLQKVKIPVGLVAAINDEVLPYREHAYRIIQYLVPAKLKLMRKEISHSAFLNQVTEEGRRFLQKHAPTDPPCCDRKSTHREVGSFAIDFFREFL